MSWACAAKQIRQNSREIAIVDIGLIRLPPFQHLDFLSNRNLILVADREPETALDHYKQRWKIETLGGCLKTRSFDLESIHMTDPGRAQKVVALLAISYCLCIVTEKLLDSFVLYQWRDYFQGLN